MKILSIEYRSYDVATGAITSLCGLTFINTINVREAILGRNNIYVTDNVITNELNRYFIDSIRNIVDSISVMYDVNEDTENVSE